MHVPQFKRKGYGVQHTGRKGLRPVITPDR